MSIPQPFRTVLLAVSLAALPSAARAQLYENVGTRAQGMGGAFTAVADDATAGWWNPAGLATGAYFNLVIEKGRVTEPADPSGLDPALTTGTTGFAMAFPALGINNYRFRVSQVDPPATGAGDPARQQDQGRRVRTLTASQVGVTVGQSIGANLVIGSTLKFVRGGVQTAIADGSKDGLDVADDLDVDTETVFDLDAGAMLSFTHLRLGVSVRNLTTPEFGEGDRRFTLERQSRAGLAILSGPHGLLETLVLAADFDLTTASTIFGEVRHLATGAEITLLQRRLAVRGGVSRNTVGTARTATSTGFSFALTRGFYIEGSRTVGADDSLRGWSSTVRLTF